VGIRAQGRRLSIQAVDIHEFKERSSSLQAGRAGAVPVGHFECHPLACAVIRRRFPVGARPTRQTLQPKATGAAMEVTKWLKPSDSVSRYTVTARVCRP
jgi:hypothetical protein